jgi:hypothetical protein
MLVEYINTGTALKDAEVTTNINESAKYTANTGIVTINTANTGIDGTGSIGTVITGASNGTLVKTITVQAIGNTTRGMVRLYIYNPFSLVNYLLDEIDIPAVVQSATQPAFSITYELDYNLQAALAIVASTQNAESFIVTATGLDFTY